MTGVARLAEHFETAEILTAFARGFHGEDRVRALLHFGGDCPACGAVFANLAGREREEEAPPHPREHRDFVARALERWHLERQGAPETSST